MTRGRACVGLLGSLGIIAQQRRRIMTAARGDNCERGHAGVEQHRFVGAPKIVKPHFEAQVLRHAGKLLR